MFKISSLFPRMAFSEKDETDVYLYLKDKGFEDSVANVLQGN